MTEKWTKEKRAEYYKIWCENNKEKRAEYYKKWREDNKNHIKEYMENNKESIKKKAKKYRGENKEKLKQSWKDWYKEHPERSPRRRFTESKNKAVKIRKINWNLTFEQYLNLIQMPCYYCDNKLGQPVKRSCGLDRLDSNNGYEIQNVVSCCNICNTIKNEHLTPEETKAAVYAVLQIRQNKSFSTT